jgi:predicted RNA binding protein YcfA (HicA-like mRNA interferase family)
MSPKLRRLNGSKVVAILGKFGFSVASQKGSHAKLKRIGPMGDKQILTVPLHEELDIGTVHAVMKQASRFISEDQLKPFFFE